MIVDFPTEMDEDLKEILGTVCFRCISLAEVLRSSGREIGRHAEDEQAAVIHWLLAFYLEDRINWRANARKAIHDMEVARTEKKVKTDVKKNKDIP